jgi:hypothetical protein
MTASINAMTESSVDVEDRIFELLGERKTPLTISRELGLGDEEGPRLVWKVVGERGMPSDERIRRNLDRLAAIRF